MKKIILPFALLFFGFINSQTNVNLSWAHGFGDIHAGDDNAKASVTDAAGNLYITGQIADTTNFNPGPGTFTLQGLSQAYFAKYNSIGALVWANALSGNGFSSGLAIDVDALGNVYVSGSFNNGVIDFDPSPSIYTITAQANDLFLAKYTSGGAFTWAIAVAGATAAVQPDFMKVNGAGDIVLVGNFFSYTPVNFNPAGPSFTIACNSNSTDGFVAKYNASGILQWGFAIGDVMTDYVNSVDIDASNNVYVSGEFELSPDFDPSPATAIHTSNGQQDMFFAKYSSGGNFLWVDCMGGPAPDGAYRAKLNNAGEFVVSGYMSSSSMDADPSVATLTLNKVGSGTEDFFLGKYNASTGNLVWAKNTGGNGHIYVNSITVDQQNNIYLAGSFDAKTNFIFSPGSFTMTPLTTSFSDIFLAKYDNSTNFIYAHQIGGGNALGNVGYNVNVDNGNNIILSGTYSYPVNVDFSMATNTLTSFGGTDFFMVKYAQCISPDTPTLTASSLTMCANGVATLSIANGNLNSATTWVWASIACGSSTLGTGSTVTVSPLFLTSYFVRGEGGCINPGSCASATVAVSNSKDITGQVTTSTSVPVPGYVILYNYEGPQLAKWDSITYQNVDALGNFTFNAVNSNSYILMCLPNSSSLQTTYSPNAIGWKGANVFIHGCANNTTVNISAIPFTTLVSGPGVFSGTITEGPGYGLKGNVFSPGNPIGRVFVKAGKNPGGNIVAEVTTNSLGEYTISNLPVSNPGENYFLYVDIPGLDTNGTFHRAITTTSTQYTNLGFIVDSMYINPVDYTGLKELKLDGENVSIYPNPTKDLINIELDAKNISNVELELMDVFGRSIQQTKHDSVLGKFKTRIEVSQLNRGIYFIIIRVNNYESRSKIVLTE